MEFDLKADSAILSYIISELLPYSRKGLWVSFKQIMDSEAILNLEIPEKDVWRVLMLELCSNLFWDRKIEGSKDQYEFCINLNRFFTLEERSLPNYDSENLYRS